MGDPSGVVFSLAGAAAAGQHKVQLWVAGEAALLQKLFHHPGNVPAVGRAYDNQGLIRFKGILCIIRIKYPLPHKPVHGDQLILTVGSKLLGDETAVSGSGKI